ncbi:MAG: 7-carboxy-7-deazaguanine synthase QueE [Planctomycetota bacterium]
MEGAIPTGHLSEIFLSIQGEGIHVGRAHLFLRLGGCPLRCRYCDTPGALVERPRYRLALPGGREEWGVNPVAAEAVAPLLRRVDPDRLARAVAVTGGEPLHQPDFLADLLPRLRPPLAVYLETAGVHAEALERVVEHVDIVAMDFKLDSVAREGDRCGAHAAFLELARRRSVFVKVVVSQQATVAEIETAARLVAKAGREIPLVLQPETDRSTGRPASGPWLLGLLRAASGLLQDVRVIPQTHKFLGLD